MVFEDVNGDGLRQDGETGLAGVAVQLLDRAGQGLIKSFGNAADGRSLANWLAGEFPSLFGKSAGAGNDLTGKSDADVASYFQSLFNVQGQKVRAQILGAALAVFTTSPSLNTAAASRSLQANTLFSGINQTGDIK